jgi:hypothetical protein
LSFRIGFGFEGIVKTTGRKSVTSLKEKEEEGASE